MLVQAKHQPLQFLKVSTLREYLRYDFLDLVGEALEPPPASDLAACDPWRQEEDLPEPALEDDDKDTGPEGDADGLGPQGSEDADASTPHSEDSDVENSNYLNSMSAHPSIPGIAKPVSRGGANADGQFDFERLLQDFVLLTFLVGLSTPCPPLPHCLPFTLPPVMMLLYLWLHAPIVGVCSGSRIGIEAMAPSILASGFVAGPELTLYTGDMHVGN